MISVVIGKQKFMTQNGLSMALTEKKGDHCNLN